MGDFIKGTWLATVLFVAPLALFEWSQAPISPGSLGTFSLGALLATPFVWWWLIARMKRRGLGRGAVAGALCAAVIVFIPTIQDLASVIKGGSSPQGGLSAAVGLAFVVNSWIVGIPLGAGLGMLTALIENARAEANARRAR